MKNFDEKIRDKLFDAEMPVASGVWESIEKNLDRKDKRPVIWLMLLMMLTGLPALYFAVYYQSDSYANHALIMEDVKSDVSSDFASNDYVRSSSVQSAEFDSDIANINTKRYTSVRSLTPIVKQALGFQIASGFKQYNNTTTGYADKESDYDTHFAESLLLVELNSDNSDNSFESQFDFGDREEVLFGTKMECPRFRQQWPMLYAYGDISLSHPMQSLEANAFESSDLISIREGSESSLPSYGIRAGLGYDFYSGLFIQAGIAYNQINTKFLHIQNDVINNKTSIVIDTLLSPEGEILSITRDTTVVQEIGTTETTAQNSFRMIDVPVEVGYLYPVSDKFNVRASVGVAFNLRMASSGYMLDANGDVFPYGDSDTRYFKTRAGLSYLASLGLETRLSDKMYLNAGIRWRHYGTEFNTAENPVDQKFTSIGLNAGIRYRL